MLRDVLKKHVALIASSSFQIQHITVVSAYALVAQMDRVLVSEAKGRGFDSRRAHQIQTYGHVNLRSQVFLTKPPCPARAQQLNASYLDQAI